MWCNISVMCLKRLAGCFISSSSFWACFVNLHTSIPNTFTVSIFTFLFLYIHMYFFFVDVYMLWKEALLKTVSEECQWKWKSFPASVASWLLSFLFLSLFLTFINISPFSFFFFLISNVAFFFFSITLLLFLTFYYQKQPTFFRILFLVPFVILQPIQKVLVSRFTFWRLIFLVNLDFNFIQLLIDQH